MTITLSQSIEPAVELSPELRQALHAALSQYLGYQEQIALLTDLANTEKATIQTILEEAGTNKVTHDDHTVSLVRGISTSLDKKRLVALGVGESVIAQAMVTKPKKPYITVRKVGERDDAE